MERKTFGGLWKESGKCLHGNWGKAILTAVISIAIQIAVQKIPYGWILQVLLLPLTLGLMLFFLNLARAETTGIADIFQPFRAYVRNMWVMLRPGLFTVLWGILFIIPGIVASFRYAMTGYIALDHPELPAKTCMEKSISMMYGHKMQFFGYTMLFSLIGGAVIICTLGIGIFWFIPRVGAFAACFYNSLAEKEEEEAVPILPENRQD